MVVHGNRAGLTWHLLQGLGHLYLENHSVCTCHYIKHNNNKKNNIKTSLEIFWNKLYILPFLVSSICVDALGKKRKSRVHFENFVFWTGIDNN